MYAPYEIAVGLRYLSARRGGGFISFISLISMLGIALGVAVLIVVLSVMNGFEKELRDRILGMASAFEENYTALLAKGEAEAKAKEEAEKQKAAEEEEAKKRAPAAKAKNAEVDGVPAEE